MNALVRAMTRGRVLGVVMVPCMHTDDFDSEKGRNVIRIVCGV